eukprot:gene5044-3633_t
MMILRQSWLLSSMAERRPSKTEVRGSIPLAAFVFRFFVLFPLPRGRDPLACVSLRGGGIPAPGPSRCPGSSLHFRFRLQGHLGAGLPQCDTMRMRRCLCLCPSPPGPEAWGAGSAARLACSAGCAPPRTQPPCGESALREPARRGSAASFRKAGVTPRQPLTLGKGTKQDNSGNATIPSGLRRGEPIVHRANGRVEPFLSQVQMKKKTSKEIKEEKFQTIRTTYKLVNVSEETATDDTF